MKKALFWTLIVVFDLLLTLVVLVYLFTYHPNELDEMEVICKENSPLVSEKTSLTILNWNVQFLAGKKYVFFFDVPDNKGPHERPEEWMLGEQQKKYYTHVANDPDVKGEADRILDYIFYSKDWKVLQAEVIQENTSHISDHYPILAKFEFTQK